MWVTDERGLIGADLFAMSFQECLVRRYIEEELATYASDAIEKLLEKAKVYFERVHE
jgi:hypothetical protein